LFPKGLQFGIKQPLLIISYGGTLILRNDNPQNIVFKNGELSTILINCNDFKQFKQMGMSLYKNGEYFLALRSYMLALKLGVNEKLQVLMLSNIASCYMKLCLYEHAL